jgi:hypothetical protein
LAIACGCAVATAAFTGGALAGNGHGQETAPGQLKKTDTAQTQPAPAPAPAPAAAPVQPAQPQSTAPGQTKKETAAPQQQAPAPGQAKKAEAASSSSSSEDSQPGRKPSSTTSKWTHCTTGGAGTGSASCTAAQGTPGGKSDVSKRYGNGQTAAQIAVSRGAPDGTTITGPGNSQPHKVTACGKPNNKSGGVDVHAVKSYSTAACQPTPAAPSVPQAGVSHVCGQDTITTTSSQVVGMLHHNHLMTNPKSAHFRPMHGDTPATQTLTETKVVATGESCAPQQQPVAPPAQGQAPVQPVQPVPPVLPVMPVTPVQPVLPVTPAQPGSSAAPTTSRGGVLGEHVVVTKPAATQAKPAAHGVLGTVTHVAGTSLPFTGFPLWVAALVALGLIGGGLALRHRTAAGRV